MEVLGFLLGTFFFVLLEAFFAGSEIALVSVDRGKVLSLYERTGQDCLKDFYENPEEYITLTMLGYTLSIVFASTFYTLAVMELSEHLTFLKGFEVALSATLVVFTLLLGELIPKSLFQRHAERLLFPSLFVLSRLKTFTRPLLVLSRQMSRSVTKLLKKGFQEKLQKEDLLRLMEQASNQEESLRIALNLLTLKELFITEKIKPLQEVVMVEESASGEQVMALMKESQYRRLPVYSKRVDQIVGYVDFFDLIQSKHPKLVKEHIRSVHYFSEFTTLEKAFEVFKKSKEQMGVVVDERGNLLGIVTWDDLQSYIVGSSSEGEKSQEEEVLEIERGRWIMQGSVEKEKVERVLGVELPAGPYTTLGGFLCFYNRGIPERSQVISYGGYLFKVVKRDEKRLIKVMVEKNVPQK
ncbi:MAG: hemolysin family protein [Aquificaceae bacterium]|nr:hemolysin family protein [Aquificaceae bacterium]MDW8097757.1 hemolysin family protein [Aquificaceae bacterium]